MHILQIDFCGIKFGVSSCHLLLKIHISSYIRFGQVVHQSVIIHGLAALCIITG